MKINIDITTEEFKDLFVPGKTQQEFMEKLFFEFQKSAFSTMTETTMDPTKFSKFWMNLYK